MYGSYYNQNIQYFKMVLLLVTWSDRIPVQSHPTFLYCLFCISYYYNDLHFNYDIEVVQVYMFSSVAEFCLQSTCVCIKLVIWMLSLLDTET